MAHKIEDRVSEVTSTAGFGPFALGGAMLGYRAFNTVCVAGDTFYGVIEAIDSNGNPSGDWVTGLFSYSAINEVSILSSKASSNGVGALVNFGAGNKRVSLELIAFHLNEIINGVAPAPTPTPSPSVFPTGFGAADVGALTFQDEFDGVVLNTNVWNDHIWYESSDPTINYNLTDSCLCIWPQKNANGRFVNRTIDTDGKFYQKYGWFEARMKLPIGFGCWPAFWIFGHETGDRPEIDVMEAYCGGQNAGNAGWSTTTNHPLVGSCTIHGPSVSDIIGEVKTSDIIPFGTQDLSADFHTYAVKWDSNAISMYLDGALVGTIDVSAVNALDQRLYILFDLWFGSAAGDPNAGGATPPQGIGNSFQVDYIRVWSLP